MKVFFDNCTSPVLATTLDGFIRSGGHQARHIAELPCGRHAPDIEWSRMLRDDPARWIVVTGDERISRNRAERQAYRSAGLFGFVLSAGFQKRPLNETAALLLWRWPEMLQLANLVSGAALYELPVNRRSRMRSLSL